MYFGGYDMGRWRLYSKQGGSTMNKKELARAALNTYLTVPRKGWNDDSLDHWINVIDTLVPLITKDIADMIRDTAFKVFDDTDGQKSIRVHTEHEGLVIAETLVRIWTPDD
jgi:hypothetical protein